MYVKKGRNDSRMLENQKGRKIFLFLIITCDVLDFLLQLFISYLLVNQEITKAEEHKTMDTRCGHYNREKPP
jgi:hypothetical protein